MISGFNKSISLEKPHKKILRAFLILRLQNRKKFKPYNQELQVIFPNKCITEINWQQGSNYEDLKNPFLQQKIRIHYFNSNA